MATLYKKPNSSNWYAQFTDADGKRISRTTGTTKKREAAAVAADLESKERDRKKGNPGMPAAYAVIVNAAAREALAGELTLARAEELVHRLHRISNPAFKVVSLSDHLSGWVKDQEPNVGESAAGVYWDMHRRVTAAVGPKIAAAPVGDFTVALARKALLEIRKMKVRKSDRCLTAATVNMDLGALRRALHTAVTAGLAKVNVAVGIKPMSEDDSTERAPFEVAEVRKIMAVPANDDEWEGATLFGGHTGLRLRDVVQLGDEHLDGTRLVIRPKKTQKSKKVITIPLSPPCLAWIARRNHKGQWFPRLAKLSSGTLSTTFTRIMAKAGVPRDIVLPGGINARRSFHCLRHSFTSWLAEADVHADIRQKLTGHSSSKVHQIYTHHDEALDRAIEMLPAL